MPISSALAFLLATQNADGGWGYAPGQASIVEPSAAVALAIQADPAGAEAYRQAIDWLRQGQHADGGWGLTLDDPESTWQTAWAVLVLGRAAGGDAAFERGVEWLLSARPLPLDEDQLQKDFMEIYAIDSSLRGWSWLPGEMTWIEPTALAMVCLELAPLTSAGRDRLSEAARYIQDRRCKDGGWNMGAPFMLGAVMPPRANPTAWSLLALAGFAPEAIRPGDVATLRAEMLSDDSVPALAWGLIALRALGQDDAQTRTRLVARQGPGGDWGRNPYHTAMAMIALEGGF